MQVQRVPSPSLVLQRGAARTWLVVLVLMLSVGGGAYWLGQRSANTQTNANAEAPSGKPPGAGGGGGGSGRGGRGGPGMGGDRPLPVAAVPVEQRTLRVVQNAIGTATPQALVTVRAKVDGELLRVSFQEGSMVKQGQLLAEIDPRAYRAQLDQAQGQLTRDEALLTNARLDLKRYQDLLAKDSIARQQVDTQAALVRQLEGTVRAGQGQLAAAQLALDHTRIVAPVSGRVGLRNVDAGNQIKASDALGLTTIAQMQPMLVVFAVPEARLPLVFAALKQGRSIAVEAWDRDQKFRLATGTVLSADNQIDPATGTAKLKARFANTDLALYPNQFVNVRLLLDEKANALVAPSASVLQGSKGTFVYKVLEDKTVKVVPVQVGLVDGDFTEITGNLKAGDQLVRDGTDRLKDGAKINLIGGPAQP